MAKNIPIWPGSSSFSESLASGGGNSNNNKCVNKLNLKKNKYEKMVDY